MSIVVERTDTFEQWRVKTNQIAIALANTSSNISSLQPTVSSLSSTVSTIDNDLNALESSYYGMTKTVTVALTGQVTGSASGNLLTGTTNPITVSTTLANSGVAAGTYGSANGIPVITVDAKGRVTSASNVTVNIPPGTILQNDTTSNVSYYLSMANVTAGNWSAAFVSSTKLYFNPSTGTLNSTNFNSLSDARYKMDVYTLTPETSCGIISNLRPVSFRWISNNKRSFGFIAQELEQYLPELVETSETGVKTVNYNGLIALLTSTITHLEKRIEVLENKR